MAGHVFISCSRNDADYVRRLGLYLIARGLHVWTKEVVLPGAQPAHTLDERIATCAAFIPVMSPRSRESDWVSKEILLARRWGRPIMPILHDGEPFSELLDLPYEDTRGGRMPSEAYLQHLVWLARAVADARPLGRSGAVASVSGWPGHLEVFAVTGDGRVMNRWRWMDGREDGWNWHEFGSPPVACVDITAISHGSGHRELFLVGSDGKVWHRWFYHDLGGWSAAWACITTGPEFTAVASVSGWPGHMEVFAVTGDGRVLNRWQWADDREDGWSWHEFGSPPVACAGITATSRRPGHRALFAVGVDGEIWHRSCSRRRWSDWVQLRTGAGAGPGHNAVARLGSRSLASASARPGRVDIFAINLQGEVIHRAWIEAGGRRWSEWNRRFGPPARCHYVTATSPEPGQLEVFAVADDGAIWHRCCRMTKRGRDAAQGWSDCWERIPAPATG